MKVAHILFSAPMVCALLDDRKTQTRRTAAPRWAEGDLLCVREAFRLPAGYNPFPPARWIADVERLPDAPNPVHYEASGAPPHHETLGTFRFGKLRPSIHMPRRASRITLRVEEVRAEPLKAISEADALAEGVVWSDRWQGFVVPGVEHPNRDFPVLSRPTAREMYAALWDVINGSGEWLGNPTVYATTFSVEKANVDQVLKRAA